ncbi:MAG TPA: MerR family transcriptional regulator [Candidatus Avamphibacillus sp.]|nr:MerR family transcriptional regulator [Candidatus Avamphibacillus sp.]
MKGITIGQVAKASNINIETVRYYERRGLIPEPPRNESGYRMFSKEAIQDIKFIKRAQGLGFTLEEIKKLLSASNDEESFKAEELYDFATEKIQEIESKIREFNNMKSLLEDVARKCPGPGVPRNQCSIIKKLTEGENENG